MVIVKLQSGLGNQLFQFATGLSISKKNKSKLIFEIGSFRYNYRKFKLDFFLSESTFISNWKLKFLNSRSLGILSKYFSIQGYHKSLKDPIWNEIKIFDCPDLILTGYWSFNSYFDDVRSTLVELIRIKPSLKNNFYNIFYEKIANTNSIGVHIRRGDYVSNKEFSEFFGILEMEYYEKAFTILKNNFQNCVFFIFTDDLYWVKNNFIIGEDIIIVSDPNYLKDYHEFDLMRNCKHHIIANSTFSWWAAYLNDNEGRVIIQPSKWYKSEHAQKVYDSKKFLFIEGAIRV